MALVAVLLVHDARPAAAQSPIWSATLTVEGTTLLGCETASACATALTDNTFVYGGTEYTVESLTLTGGSTVILVTDSDLPASLDDARLQVGRVQLNNGDHAHSSITWTAITTLSWTAGSRLQLRLLPPPPDDWRSWNPTLTVADTGTDNGCSAASTPCSTALTDDTFVFDDISYTITGITQTVGFVRFVFAPSHILPSSLLQPFKMRVDSVEEPLAGHIGSTQIDLSISGLNWSVGDRVRLRLIPGPPVAPTGLSLAPGPRADTLAAAWTAPDDSLTARVTGYEVRHKEFYATGWETTQVGTTPRATLDAHYVRDIRYSGQVRALSAAGASPWSAQAQGAPKAPPGGPAATPLNLLSASRTSVTEGGTVTITARLAGAAAAAVTIPLVVEGTAGTGDYSLSSPGIAIAQGQRSGSVTLTITDDSHVEGAEILYITPDIRTPRGNSNTNNGSINEAVPGSSAVAYQVTALRINIAASDQPTTTGSEPASAPPYHSDPYLAELQRRIVACAQSQAMRTAIDNYVKGTGSDAEIATARANTPACQYN